MEPRVGGCFTVRPENRRLEEKHFSGFSQSHRLFFSSEQKTEDQQQIDKDEQPCVLGYAGRDEHPADGAR